MSGLRFGYRQGLPEGVETAWGCRAIWRGFGIPDIVWDRTDAIGPDGARHALLEYLRTHVGNKPWENVRDDARSLGLDPRAETEAIIFEDEIVVMKASTNGSGGYLYVVAYHKEDVPEATRIAQRLEELRTELREERISWGELAELQSLAEHIQPGDVELLEAAGVPEFEEGDS